MVEFDSNGRFITPSWSDPIMGTANSVHIFDKPQATADNPQLKDKGLPPTVEGGIMFPSNPNDQMFLSRVPGPEGDNHNWYIAYTYINPRLDDPAAKDKDGWLPYALIVQDQNGYHQVTDPPAKGSGAAAAMAAGLAMWGFQRQPPGTGGGTGRGGRGGTEEGKPRKGDPSKEFKPGVNDPDGNFSPKERSIADYLVEKQGWQVTSNKADHTVQRQKNPEGTIKKGADDPGRTAEFKTLESGSNNALKRNMLDTAQLPPGGEIVIDGRVVGTTRAEADRAYSRALGQPGGTVASTTHVILADGSMATYGR
ncbi:hypothetical protein [Nocardia colli]|uniref:hypothetical protein n=1 Tax=Nocardia colli TaxID=2545717 RepID=UPI0035D7246D